MQVDGSHHDWLEDRGPRLVLLIAVDDATGNVPYALFRHEEDAQGYFLLLEPVPEVVPKALASFVQDDMGVKSLSDSRIS